MTVLLFMFLATNGIIMLQGRDEPLNVSHKSEGLHYPHRPSGFQNLLTKYSTHITLYTPVAYRKKDANGDDIV